MERKVIETGDGSKTLHLSEWNEQYHSIHGALREAKHVFIANLLSERGENSRLSIFEMGFGTGLNAFLTYQAALQNHFQVDYTSLEAYPVTQEEFHALDYTSLLDDENHILDQLFLAEWNGPVNIDEVFTISKLEIKLEDWVESENTFDFIFYDAFGPRVQPHLWTLDIFKKLYSATKLGGIFLTYCAKGQVRRDLESAGYRMTRLPGPPGKREMLLGRKV